MKLIDERSYLCNLMGWGEILILFIFEKIKILGKGFCSSFIHKKFNPLLEIIAKYGSPINQ